MLRIGKQGGIRLTVGVSGLMKNGANLLCIPTCTIDLMKITDDEDPCVGVVFPRQGPIEVKRYIDGVTKDDIRRDIMRSFRREIREASKNDNYLLLTIDLSANKERIMRELEECIDFRRTTKHGLFGGGRKNVKQRKTRNREPAVSPWQVYDLVHQDKRNLLQITKQLFRVKDNPTDSKRTKAYYEQVTRAYKKAKKMISEVRPQVSSK